MNHYISTARRYIDLSSIYVVTDEADSGLQTTYTLAPGQTHSFSCYVVADSTGVRLKAQCGDTVVTSEEQQINSEWRRLQVSYTNNTTETQTVTYGVYTTGSGNFYMDCAQLELAPTASAYNLMNNGDFRYAINSNTWVKSNCTTDDKIVTLESSAVPQLDNHVFQITGEPTKAKSVKQVVYLPGKAGDSLTLSGWAKGNSVPLYTDDAREFAVRATIHYASGTDSEPFIARFNPDSDQWQYTAAEIVADEDFWRITVELVYSKNVNTVYFDGIQLLKDRFGDKYSYDARGNLISVWDSCDQTSTYIYSAGDDLTEQTLPSGEKITYEYDNYHNVTKVTEENGLVSTLGYDAYGNNTSVSISDGTTVISSSAAYTAEGNLPLSTTDALGRTTRYGYDENTGLLEWVQYPEDTDGTNGTADTRTTYSYDDMYRMVSAACTTDTGLNLEAGYTYTDDLLTKIETPTTTYSFTYEDFSLRTGVSVGDRTLATYTYTTDGNNRLSALDYGNDGMVQYTYDDKGRVTQQTYEDGDTVTYTYDNTGGLATFYDSATGITGKYISDFSGRVGMYTEDADGYQLSLRYGYDSRSRLTGMSEYINGHRRGINYVYDSEDRLESYKKANGKRTYAYDGFDRVISMVTSQVDTPVITTDYTYTAPQTGTTSGQVESIEHTLGTSQTPHVTYTYTYDNNGNILTVSDGSNTTSYVYDSANQLTRENNQAGNFTHTWTYDNAGNITKRTEYAYTTGALGEEIRSVEYKYEDTQGWGDLLTAYNSTEIDYDGIGNPTDDGTWEYTWEHGRELASMTDGETTWQYAYNADGLRTKRTNGTTTYNYVYYGGQLQYMSVGSEELYFTTAPDGTAMGVIYQDYPYYYMTNLQGDVVGLVNHHGVQVVAYTYDAWGNILSTTGTMASTLGAINPIRYRGYVYDSETGLYYLQSRYYDPEMGRFINGDGYVATGQGFAGNNMFAYCGNNPVNYIDSCGTRRVAIEERNGGAVAEEERKKGANEEAMLKLFGVNSVDELPIPKDAMVFVENTYSISILGISYVWGKTIVMDCEKYCEYSFEGFSLGVGFPYDYTITAGYVYGVEKVKDYSGAFFSSSFNQVLTVTGGAIAPNGVRAEIVSGNGFLSATLGVTYTSYKALSKDWIYGAANITWINSPYSNIYPDESASI